MLILLTRAAKRPSTQLLSRSLPAEVMDNAPQQTDAKPAGKRPAQDFQLGSHRSEFEFAPGSGQSPPPGPEGVEDDMQKLLAEAISKPDKAESVVAFARILATEDGRDFISRLDRKDAELCIEILDYVSPSP